MTFRSALYRGELLHARHDHLARRVFRYGVYMAALDLDELPALDRALRLFSHRRRNLFSFDERDFAATLSPRLVTSTQLRNRLAGSHPGGGGATTTAELHDSLAALRAGSGLPPPATTRLVTNLRVLGYVFNPVSFFLDYDATGALTSVIAEVNNTYGGRLRYVLGPAHRLDRVHGVGTRVGFRHVRELFVSPFLHGPASYDFWFDAPLDGSALEIEMHVQRVGHEHDTREHDAHEHDPREHDTREHDTREHDGRTQTAAGGRLLTARFTGTRAPLSDRTLLGAALRYPLMSAQVIGLIHLEALKLRLAGVPYRRPGRDHRPLDS